MQTPAPQKFRCTVKGCGKVVDERYLRDHFLGDHWEIYMQYWERVST